MRKLPSLKALQAFDAAARLGSFSAAAEEMSVSPSAVSHQIRALEVELGVMLFERINRTIVLTDLGKAFADRVGRGFSELEAASVAIGRTTRFDILTIHCAPSLAKQWLMPRLKQFCNANPDLDVRLNATPNPINLLSIEADFDIRFGHFPSQPGVRRIAFPPETMLVLCAPELLNGDVPIRAPIDMARQSLIHSELNLFSWNDWFKAEGLSDLFDEKGLRFDSSYMAIDAAVDGQGAILESHLHVQNELKSKRLVAPFGLAGYTVQGHSLNFVQSRTRLPKVEAFKSWILAELGIDDGSEAS